MTQSGNNKANSSLDPDFWDKPLLVRLVFFVLGVIYVINRSPYISFHDSLSFLQDALQGFNPATNATAHVLYANMQHVLVSVLGFLPPVLVLTLFTVGSSLLTLGLIFRSALFLSQSRKAAAAATLMLGLSFTWWQQSEIVEVYAFNSLFFMAYFYLILQDLKENSARNLIWVALLLGMSFWVHIQHILSIPFFLYYLVTRKTNFGLKISAFLLPVLAFGALLLPPLLLQTNSISAIFFDRQFQGNVMGIDLLAIMKGALKSLLFLGYNFHLWLVPLLGGIWLVWKNERKLFYQLCWLLVPYLGFALKYNVDDNYVFFLLPYLVFAVLSSLGFKALFARWKWNPAILFALLLTLSPLIYASAWFVAKRAPVAALRAYDQEKAYKSGVAHIFWPGKAHVQDPLEMAFNLYQQGTNADSVEWNYPAALEVLKLQGRIP
ncbi:MAG: DUF2723 domain-containing protein [Bacteroidia bacterium]|nr:DUF2723 domain-containing protein [Bacteroidia bacterium]